VIEVEAFTPEHLDAFAKLFEAASSPCFCRYWHFTGTKNDWLDRCANHPEENLAEQADAVRRGDDSARGLVAFEAEPEHPDRERRMIGWMKLAPRAALTKLTNLAVYRGLPSVPETWTVGCFLVHPAARRNGVAKALLAAAEAHVRAWGGRAIEGHPRRADAPLHDEEAWQGPERAFLEAGFTAVHDVAPYPVYRKVVAS
jgi:GNAT superfamily N-acetyltransferase